MQPLSKLATVGLIAAAVCASANGQETGKKPAPKTDENRKPPVKAQERSDKPTAKPTAGETQSAPSKPSSVAADKMSSDEVAIRQTGETFEAAFNKGDAKDAAEHYTKDAEHVDDEGHIYQGRETIQASMKTFFDAHPGSKIHTTVNAVRMIGPGVAIEDGLTTITLPAGADPIHTHYTAVHAKVDGKWLVASVRETAVKLQRHHASKLKQLEWITGEWVHEGNDATVVFKCHPTDNGNFLLRSFTVKVPGGDALSGTQRIGWDAQADRLRSWIFDSDGGHSEGYWHQDGDTWILKSSGITADGHPASTTSIYTFINPHTMTFQTVEHEVSGLKLPDSPKVNIVRHPPKPD